MPHGTDLRQACLNDLEAIGVLEHTIFAGQQPYGSVALRQLFAHHGSEWVVAVDGGVVGYVLVLAKEGKATLFTFAVAESYRERGLGRRLLLFALDKCVAANVEVVTLTVRPANEHARKLFKKVGFEKVDSDEEYFGSNGSRDIMERTLDPADVFYHSADGSRDDEPIRDGVAPAGATDQPEPMTGFRRNQSLARAGR
ncbi:GNAT family N-acetyltransferase [Nocardia bovistercoris]|uniref:GNAT family N-acetyltransferase n=1 Tax=Nocardia bovistercoris TaxID=2785916 RepID=A0A931I7V9_9NOCA|nr:GNAT family N-acetyltransferase [Nocardia bovistercoris]MBH0775711.1 GNAT family N-acetyltransferase [Nocardia bovistercoris]